MSAIEIGYTVLMYVWCIPLSERNTVDLDNAVLHECFGSHQLIVTGIVHNIQDTALACHHCVCACTCACVCLCVCVRAYVCVHVCMYRGYDNSRTQDKIHKRPTNI